MMNKTRLHLEKIRVEFSDIGEVDRKSGGYELIDDDGKGRRFNNLSDMRKYAAGARKDASDWKNKSIAEWRDVALTAQKQLKNIKKDCILARYGKPSNDTEKGSRDFAIYILSEHYMDGE